MTDIFLYIVNMSITASILAVIVLLLRLLLRKAPKWVSVLLWGLVAIRLICPFSLESPFSLMPKADWFVQKSMAEEGAYLNSASGSIPAFDFSYLGEDVTVHYYPIENPEFEIRRGIGISFVLSCVWITGMAGLLLYTVISTVRLRRSIGTAILVHDNIWESSAVDSPFVLGIFRPRIYVPRGVTGEKLDYVVAHEQAHIRRRDYLWKPLGFLLLTIHWFNPVMWLAYILLCRDIEMACDEKVVRRLGEAERADYSEALLECSVTRSMISACPLAFGEVGVTQRIKSVLNYKKPAFWIVVVAVIACAVTGVCFLTNPLTVRNPWVQEYVVGADGILGQVDKAKYESIHEDFAIGADQYGRAVFKNPSEAFDTMKSLYKEGLALIRGENNLPPISQATYKLYKKFGWQVTSGSAEARKQASYISGFLDIYENSFDKQKPNTDLPAPTTEGEDAFEKITIPGVIQGYAMPETNPDDKMQLTLDDVIDLSAKGYDLTWEDFAQYAHSDIGSGLYIWYLPIDELFSVRVGGGSVTAAPMYVYLCAGSGEQETRIDVRDGGVRMFIEVQKSLGDALLFGNPVRYYVELAWEEAKQVAESKNTEIDKNRFLIGHAGNDTAIWVDFYIKTDGAWSRKSIKVTIVPDADGTYRVAEDPLFVIPDTPAETSGEFTYRPIPDEDL